MNIKNKQEISFKDSGWKVFGDYNIEKQTVAIHSGKAVNLDVLCPSGKVSRAYNPLDCKELPSELSKLCTAEDTDKDREKILDFAREYGTLGYFYLHPQVGHRGVNRLLSVDPVLWILSHAQIVFFCMKIIKGLKETAYDDLKQTMRDLYIKLTSDLNMRDWLPHLIYENNYCGLGTALWKMYLKKRSEESLYQLATIILEYIINKNIYSLHPQLYVSLGENVMAEDTHLPSFNISYQCTSLIEIVYWHLATTISYGNIKQCEGCGGLFIQDEPRRRYCPPVGQRESPCAVRGRQERFQTKSKTVKKRRR